MKIFAFILLILTFNQIKASEDDSTLTKTQMYKDYLYLIQIMEQINPQIEVRKIVEKNDIVSVLKNHKSKIDGINNKLEFYSFINQSLSLCNDGHTNILHIPGYYPNIKKTIKRQGYSKQILQGNENYYRKNVRPNKNNTKLNLFTKYINGNYYTLVDFISKQDTIKSGSLVKKINEIQVDEFVNTQKQYIKLKWDFVRKKYYSNNFYKSKSLDSIFSLTIEYKNSENTYFFNRNKEVKFLKSINSYIPNYVLNGDIISGSNYFKYLPDSKSLYIKLQAMRYADRNTFPRKIRKEAKSLKLNHVIIDIRGNFGGSDLLWQNILKSIIDKPIYTDYKIAFRNSSLVQKFIKNRIIKKNKKNTLKEETLSFLNNKTFFIKEYKNLSIKPYSNSLKYNGKIFIIFDEDSFSSSLALVAFAEYNEKIISIGIPYGQLGGRGSTPIPIVLPQSKIIFTIPRTIDISNAKNAKDCYHAIPEVSINISPKKYIEYFQKIKFKYVPLNTIPSENEMINYDPWIMKVIKGKLY